MRITDLITGQASNIGSISDLLGKLNVGDVLRAQILDITANELILKLFDGSTVAASAMTPLDVKKGDFVDFKVKGRSDSQLFIETVKKDESENQIQNDAKAKLAAINIKPDEENLEIAKAIELSDLPLNKEIFDKILSSLKAFKDLDAKSAAFLVSSNIKVNENNIKSLSDIVDGRMKIGLNLNDLIGQLEESISKLNNAKTVVNTTEGFKESPVNKETAFEPNKSLAVELNKIIENVNIKGEGILNDKDVLKLLYSLVKNAVKNFDSVKANEILKLLENGINGNGINNETARDIIEFLKSITGSPEESILKSKLDGVLKNSTPGKLQGEENSGLPVISPKDQDGQDDIKKLDTLRKALQDTFIKLDSQKKDTDINIKKLYNDIYEKLEGLKTSISGSSIANNDDILNKIDNLQGNIRFLNEINNHNAYVQIPISIMNKNTSGEIYVLKRDSKRKKIDPQNVTMYISLDTVNIGKVDTLLSLNKKNISVNMRVEDKKVQEFVRENHSELYKRLADIGYKLVDLKCRIILDEANILNINDIVKKETEDSRVSIDCKI